MEQTTRKAKRTPPSLLFCISDICKVHSVSVVPTVRGKPKSDSPATGESSEDSAHLKMHSQQALSGSSESLSETSSARCEEAIVKKLLNAISVLKVAYVNLQQALMPYDAEEIMIADERFSSVLEEAAELKDLYVNVSEWSNPRYPCRISSRIRDHQNLVMELQAESARKTQIGWLRPELDELERKNMQLEEKIGRSALCREGSFIVMRGVSTEMFKDLYERSAMCIHDFAKFVIGWTKVSGWNLGQSTFPIDNHVVYKRKADKKYGVEAYLACVMLMGDREEYISLDSFDCIMSFRDPSDALMSYPDSNSRRYCRAKYLHALPHSMEGSFFGNLDHRAFVESGGHPRTQFYQKFVKMARYAWALLSVACSLNPRAEMFYVKSGIQYRKEHIWRVHTQR